MNNKIKELKEQATVLIDDDWGCIYPEFDEEKFAELIVKECISTLDPLVKDVELERAEWTALGIIEEAQFRIAEKFLIGGE